jgi:hypothetical protein
MMICEKDSIFYDSNDFNLKDDLNNGQIYLIRNKINNKCYIGQATCFTGTNNNRWGTMGRWKSHIREALKTTIDHSTALNNAIRKYGENGFEIFTLIKCHINKLDENEIYYVQLYNSLQPNGYNIKFGGYSSKNNENTIEKMKEAHLGTRRDKQIRKYEEDNVLPKYIKAHRNSGVIVSYALTKFPIGIEKKEYIKDTYFTLVKYKTKENALNEAIKYLNELQIQYKHINNEIFKDKSEVKPVLTYEEKKETLIKKSLPDNIYPIIEDKKIKGYYVDGILDMNGNKYPIKNFTERTNRHNLNAAINYITQLKFYTKNNINIENTQEIDVCGKNNKILDEHFYLPKYVNIYRINGEKKGFMINGFPSSEYIGGKYKKIFSDQKLSLQQNYENCINHLEEIKINEPKRHNKLKC